jgi:hypothetical protein
MKMSSCRPALEGGPVAQHRRPQDVDPSASEGDEGLGVPLTLSPLAVVEGPGLRGAPQAGEGRVVEDPLEDLIAPTHPTVVSAVRLPESCAAGTRDRRRRRAALDARHQLRRARVDQRVTCRCGLRRDRCRARRRSGLAPDNGRMGRQADPAGGAGRRHLKVRLSSRRGDHDHYARHAHKHPQ